MSPTSAILVSFRRHSLQLYATGRSRMFQGLKLTLAPVFIGHFGLCCYIAESHHTALIRSENFFFSNPCGVLYASGSIRRHQHLSSLCKNKKPVDLAARKHIIDAICRLSFLEYALGSVQYLRDARQVLDMRHSEILLRSAQLPTAFKSMLINARAIFAPTPNTTASRILG